MRRVSVEKIESGMVLAKEVRGRSGNVLLSKGVALNPFIGRRLKNWEIVFVHVEGEEESSEEVSAVRVSPEEVKAGLEKKFSGTLHDAIMKQIFAAVYQHRIQNAGAATKAST
jgi:hypothetical protein